MQQALDQLRAAAAADSDAGAAEAAARALVALTGGTGPMAERVQALRQGGVAVLVDAVSLEFLAGSRLDWHEALIGSHFKVENPLASSGCGCGVSFAV